MSIGNLDEAKVAYDKHMFRKRPKGWRKIGEGCSRSAYLAPSGVVYKVGEEVNNEVEFIEMRRYARWKSLKDQGIYMPKVGLYAVPHFDGGTTPVIAMEFIKGKALYCRRDNYPYYDDVCSCNPKGRMCYRDLMNWLQTKGMEDLHDDNMRLAEDGKIYVIDLGHNY